jgi:hypothetical protein
MNIRLAGFACILLAIGAWFYAHAQATPGAALPTGPNGRYQVVAADIDSEGLGGNLKHKTAIRIDTQTGRAWSLDEIDEKNGGGNFYWVPLQEAK